MRYLPIDLDGLTPTEFARLAGCDFSMVMKARAGKARFSTDRALEIERLSSGRITRTMLRPDIWPHSTPSSSPSAA